MTDPTLQAKEVLRGGGAHPQELIALAHTLIDSRAFGLARRVLKLAASAPEVQADPKLLRRVLIQQARATYRDLDRPAGTRIEHALETLRQADNFDTTQDPEILGLVGAMYRTLFETYSRKEYLERALAYYLRGYEQGITVDSGYNAINSAFVLDLLAGLEEREADAANTSSQIAASRLAQAKHIREEIIRALGPMTEQNPWLLESWWFLMMMAETAFGLGRYAEAESWLTQAVALATGSWERERAALRFSRLARIHKADLSEITWLLPGLGVEPGVIRSLEEGKVGLALSGGGFRAALFHVGVLARLAELDQLRNVQVISCVSGGAIVGTYYYLELQKLLESKPDNQITRQDYIDIVLRLEKHLLAGIQGNLRVRLYTNVLANLKVLFQPGYSRAERFGDLLEREIFSRVDNRPFSLPRFVNDLQIKPVDELGPFHPVADNWRRLAKVPLLFINATSLNTSHSWQFTPTWMGEPPDATTMEADDLDRLSRMYYVDAPQRYRRIRLGTAVAASGCTPGLFDPISFPYLYPHYTLRLVDGAVHDNQGVRALLLSECNKIIVSDGSANVSTVKNPAVGTLNVILRSTQILTSQVREALYRDLETRQRALLLKDLVVLHLKKDLEPETIQSIGSFDPSVDARRSELTSYGIRRDVQEHLSEIRSDYDAFHDVEAFSLMTSGYLMAGHELSEQIQGFDTKHQPPWSFLAIQESLRSARLTEVLRLLHISRLRGFKVFRVNPFLLVLLPIAIVLAALAILFSVGVSLEALIVVAGVLVLVLTIQLLMGRDPVSVFVETFTAVTGPLLALFHLQVFNSIYLSRGRVRPPLLGFTAKFPVEFPVGKTPAERLADRSKRVEQVVQLFETAGYRVVRFPHDADLNPLAVDVDIAAQREQQFCYVKVITPDVAGRPVDWIAASELKRGAGGLSRKKELSLAAVRPMLVLLDVQPDMSLKKFTQDEKVIMIESKRLTLESVVRSANPERAREFLQLSQ